ncbi:MAG: mannose-1-phosphate guanylyltransferase/mannose-6-phosphate isomerase [Candidatus Omnitrophota bacterium]
MKKVLNDHNFCVLLAGGSGTRFWPQSRTLEPKQFLSLHEKKSLFEKTLDRTVSLFKPEKIFIVTSELYKHHIQEMIHLYKIPLDNIIFEPVPKNTAPSVGLAVRLISLIDTKARICVLPCDHFIKNKARFLQLLKKALSECHRSLIILGIPPHRPATGYGYIKVNQKRPLDGVLRVDKYCEKPDLKTAKRFLKSGCYYWNSGIFVGDCDVFMREIKKCLYPLYQKLMCISAISDIDKVWKSVAAISFDYAVLEKTTSLNMIKASNLGWSDLGSWQAWDELLSKDKENNVLMGDIVNIGSRNVTALGKQRLMAFLGVEDLIVVDTPDALLVTKKDHSEEVKKVVEILKANHRHEHYIHRRTKRPWGSYTVLDIGIGFKIKLIEVLPQKALSLQLHKKRSEHWVVVEGRAKVIKDEDVSFVEVNESTFIPPLCPHRLINPENSILKIVEVQAGSYLEEDDIIRLKDDFCRL